MYSPGSDAMLFHRDAVRLHYCALRYTARPRQDRSQHGRIEDDSDSPTEDWLSEVFARRLDAPCVAGRFSRSGRSEDST
jgi:hypothetical protein